MMRYTVVTTALLGLSAPRQLPSAGVTVYCQLPTGTLLSAQVKAITKPLQLDAAGVLFPVRAL